MSNRYKGGVISATPPTTSTSSASGAWTLEQQMQAQAAGTWPAPPIFIEDLFSTYLYIGNGTTGQTINNGIDLTEGGLVVFKNRAAASWDWIDTNRGGNNSLRSNFTSAEYVGSSTEGITAFNSNGFTLGANIYSCNGTSQSIASWTFRKQPKFFDIVTLNSSTTTYNHSLGSTPGCIIVKCTNASGANWVVWHRSFANTTNNYLSLNTTDAVDNFTNAWPSAPTSTQFSVNPSLWANGSTGIAYLFAHDAGGFPVSGGGSTNGISCGSYTGDGAANGQLINLGYEAQWVMIKQTNASGSGWWMTDIMRGWTVNGSSGGDANLYANASDAESSQVLGQPEAQGFRPINDNVNQSGQTYIYIAIRKGPMKVPTSGTSVFLPATSANDSTATNFGFPIDAFWENNLGGSTYNTITATRLSGNSSSLVTSSTNAAITFLSSLFGDQTQNSYTAGVFGSGNSVVQYGFLRAPSFMDVVCYDGNGTTNRAIYHNLGAVPELIINRPRNYADNWEVYQKDVGLDSYFYLNSTAAPASNPGNWSTMTSSVFGAGYAYSHNYSGRTYITYLFATCPGVSKVGSYVGNDVVGRVIDCGFTSGARFIMLKKTSTTSNWYVYDTARGIVSGNEASISLNTTAAQSGSSDVIDPDASGFAVGTGASNFFNETGVTYIFLAIA